ncbi:uncharacterized protein LOC108914213 [Anoplophora glabripennis]|uniref:uncharacterized protein LOC108914213 n=1 Tax=Anoplophora glabripennis TaxID=217634 RepID=UPI0008753114|nr:uncharacterized protein LOC108914213 [Anoplophora glabripennis]
MSFTAGSEGDIAGSSSECDEHHRLTREAGGKCSPFGRRQFPRDSGCYDAPLKSTRQNQHASPQGESDTSDSAGFSDNRNNLDSVVEQCNNEILARVRQAQKNSINLKEELSYQPNIPSNAIPGGEQPRKPKDSYVSVRGQTTLVDPCRRNNVLNRGASGRKNLEEQCEADQKLTSVKYVVGGGGADLDGGTPNSIGRSCLSERSSDSGVSSSSLSSANTRDSRPVPAHHLTDKPTALGGPASPNCANRTSTTTTSTTANKEKTFQ